MSRFSANNLFNCECDSFLTNLMEIAGHNLIKRRKFLQLSLGTTTLVSLLNAIETNANDHQPTQTQTSSTIAQVNSGADTIYYNGAIVTMIADQDRVEAIAVKNGKILATGTKAKIMKLGDNNTKMVDLRGKCLMPGFIDPHSHVVMQSAKFATVNLDPSPIGDITSIQDIQAKLRTYIKENNIPAGKMVIGWGYDDTAPQGMRHPYKEDLDAVSTEHPILLVHISNHLCACNSLLLEQAGITANTPDPEGGRIQRKPNSNEPNGVLEELALLFVIKQIPIPTPEKAMELMEAGLRYYAAAGITTAQDGATGAGAVTLLEAMDKAGKLPIDVVAYPIYKGVNDELLAQIEQDTINKRNKDYNAHFRLGGVKLAVDGSIQGYTAFLSQPYYVQPNSTSPTPDKCSDRNMENAFISPRNETNQSSTQSTEGSNYRGYANMTVEEVTDWVKRCDDRNLQFLAHNNGDGATDILIEAISKIRQNQPRPELRTTIIHAQTIREDQLDFAETHGLIPSFFPIHVNYWGDRHRDIFLGAERANRISPAKSALNRNIKFTLHHDAPIAGIGMLPVASASINRLTSTGKPLGLEQKISPYEAFRAITIDAAYQYFEENRKGTLEVGKLADLVVLSDDPMAIDPLKIADIQVLETIKEGKTVYNN